MGRMERSLLPIRKSENDLGQDIQCRAPGSGAKTRRRMLENQRDDLLAFARCLDDDVELLGQEFHAPPGLLRRLLATHSRGQRDPRRWAEQGAIRKELRGRFHEIDTAVAALARGTVRGLVPDFCAVCVIWCAR